jgi:hypothetical protein
LAGLTVTTLRHIRLDPRLLNRMKPGGTKTLNCRDRFAADRLKPSQTRSRGDAINENGARATESAATPELGSAQAQMVAQHPEEGHLGRHGDFSGLSVDCQDHAAKYSRRITRFSE